MPSARHILLVDDDAVLRASLAEQLAREGAYVMVEAANAAEARKLALENSYAAAIIDQSLPDGAGDALTRELKAQGFDAPVLLLADPDMSPPAGDHITKPFRFADLLAKLNHYLSRHTASDDTPVAIGPYLFRPGAKLLMAGARKVRLTEKETDILKFLHAAGVTVARETLLHEVWGYNPAVTTHTLETHIYRLRKKIEDGDAKILLTEGGGYRLGT
ncbi:MAG TPA: response regulator transcription factor [Rhizomicrobium sp.]|jgi:DNA-binding response OmpR family regulator